MTISTCPRCERRIVWDSQTQDFEHTCNSGNATLDNEDIVVMGSWEDYTGSDTNVGNVMMQGAENKLFGTDAQLEGEDVGEFTRRGERASTHRQRQHLEFIKLKGGKE